MTAWKRNGWIEIYIRSEVDVPLELLKPHETLMLVIVPEKHEPPTAAEERTRLSRARARYVE